MTDCEQTCREYVAAMHTPAMAGKYLEVSPRRVQQLAAALNLGIVVGFFRLFTTDELEEMNRYRNTKRYGGGKGPATRAKRIEQDGRKLEAVTLSPAYAEAARKLRGETS